MSALEKDLEIIALRSQLAVVQQKVINRKMRKALVGLPLSAWPSMAGPAMME